MPIAQLKPNADTPIQTNLPEAVPEAHKSIVVEDIKTPVRSLITYVEGAPWTVMYFSQLIGETNDLRDFDPSQPEIYQQYTKIHGLQLRVTSPLTDSYNNETGITKVTGSAHVPTCILPNKGDLFLANIDTGDDALFRVTMVERKTFNTDSVYFIEYSLFALLPQHPEWFDLLNQKVQREYYFHLDRLADGLDALVIPEQHEAIHKSFALIDELYKNYYRWFYNKSYGTLVLPYQSYAMYDPYVVNFMMKITGSLQAPEVQYIHNLSIMENRYLNQPTIWDALLECSENTLAFCNKKMGWISTRNFFRSPTIESIRYRRMHYITFPIDPDVSIATTIERDPIIPEYLEVTPTTAHHGYTDLLYNRYDTPQGTIKLVPTIWESEYYVMSEAFYSTSLPKSLLETLVWRYLRNESIDVRELLSVTKNYTNWTRMEQFYFIPVILLLLRATLGGINV